MLRYIFIILAFFSSACVLHFLFLWLEKNGWLYYKNKKSEHGFLAGTLEEINSVLNPAIKHTVEMKQNQVTVMRQKANNDEDKNISKI